MRDGGRDRRERREDVRLRGFSTRASLAEATAWVDAHAAALGAEAVEVDAAAGRVLRAALHAPADLPATDRAGEDGHAVRSRDTVGAGAYHPLPLALQAPGAPVGPVTAARVVAGAPLPPGADAVVPFGAAHEDGASLEVVVAIAEGAGVERRGQDLRAGAALLEAGRVLRAEDAALLACLGVPHVDVVRRPRVRLVIAGAKRGPTAPAPPDAAAPLLAALVARDGGAVAELVAGDDRSALAAAMAAPGVDAVLVAGRTGTGPDDVAPLALGDAGDLALHGVALRPGGSAGLGRVGGVPVLLLPGDPLAGLCVYELLGGRLIRRLGGRAARLPHATCDVEVGRKIVSAVGVVDLCRVRLVGGRVEPIGSVEHGGLASVARADGFVLVPAPLEGIAPGARVTVHLYGAAPAELATGGAP
jgi:molybdopterin molybdotransferase